MSDYKVIKRDGRSVDFDRTRITNAILAAFNDVDGEITDKSRNKANEIAREVEVEHRTKDLEVEEIQDFISTKLMSSQRKDVAMRFIQYREKRAIERDKRSKERKIIRSKLMATNVQHQNANVDEYSFGGRSGEASSELNRQVALEEVLSPMAYSNHINNEIYEHDLDHYVLGDHNCLTVPIDDLLQEGFNTRQTDVRPAQSVNTAFQLLAVIFQIQSLNQFGGVSASHLDWTMVPYVRKSFRKHFIDGTKYIARVDADLEEYLENNRELDFDREGLQENYPKVYQYAMDMTVREVYQAVEGMFHNLNTLQSRSGNQLPFTSINFGTCILKEGRLITKAILDTSIRGIGKLDRTSIFPCTIFQCMKGVNRKPGDPNYDLYLLALKSTAKRLYPNYVNVDWSNNEGYDRNDPRTYTSTMGCRTYNGYDANGFGQLKDGRGNICPVTIILPTIAMEAKEHVLQANITYVDEEQYQNVIVEEFIKELDQKIYEAKVMLQERFDYICSQNPASARFMYENGTMKGYVPEEGIISALKHGTLALGQIGLSECLRILIGKDQTTDEGMVLAKRIEQLFKDRCAQFKKEEHFDKNGNKYYLNYGVYYTPAENLCYKSMKAFQKKYGKIEGISDKDYFTNSVHVPVWTPIDPFKKIDIESELDSYSNAGCILYVELESSAKNNIQALETIVNYAMDKDVPYFAINVPNDMCMDCGFTDDIPGETCPKCGSTNIQRLRRVTGYLTGNYTTAFNLGKQEEVRDRFKNSSLLMNWNR